MATLASYQKLDRVLTGLPFGDGRDGALTISSNTTQSLTVQSCSGSATSTTLAIASGAFTNGDVVLIHQTRGTGVGQYEINKVSSGGGTTSLTLSEALHFTYTDSGASQAQVIKIPMYTDVTINTSRTLSPNSWDGNINGFVCFVAKGTTTTTGIIEVGGYGHMVVAAPTFNGSGRQTGNQGEGSAGAGAQGTAANGNAGGGGAADGSGGRSGGGGGGNGAVGTNGQIDAGGTPGTGGAESGAADLTTFTLGGSGGTGCTDTNVTAGSGALGGGIVWIWSKNIVVTGGIDSAGYAAGNQNTAGAGGGGAGGTIFIGCQTATLGTGLITSAGGAGGVSDQGDGGAGAVGRIAIHHSGTITGTTSPTFTDVTDTSLVESTSTGFFNFF